MDGKINGQRPPFDVSLLDGLPDPVILLDHDRRIVDCNTAAREFLGADAIESDLAMALDSSRLVESVDAALRGESAGRGEVSIPFPVSRTYELNVWTLPAGSAGEGTWVMVVLHDVTAARKADRMRADFVSNVSHELRSPLSSLRGFIETLRGPARDDPAATARFLEIMETEAKRMTRLINDLLALSKVETEEHIRPEGAVDVMGLLTQVANILSVRAAARRMTIGLDVPQGMPKVVGDADELTQVFQNLVDNAITYGREGTPIRIAVRPADKVPGTGVPGVSVAVVNRGEGIAAKHLPRLTERFYRVDKGRSRSMGGTGLGLAVVKHIVSRHRGHLAIDSVPGEDTTFTVVLPRVRAPAPDMS